MTHITIQRSVMETMLEVLQWSKPHNDAVITHSEAITAIKAALAQQEPWCMKMNRCKTKCADCPDEPAQEPVAWLTKDKFSNKVDLDAKNAKETTGWSAAFPVYTTPQQRPWVGLTHDERYECIHGESVDAWDIAEAVEAKLKELNQ